MSIDYTLKLSKFEMLSYVSVSILVLCLFDFEKAIFMIVLFFLLVRLSFWDLKYKLIPQHLVLTVFFISFFVTPHSLFDSVENGLIYCGGIFMLNEIVVYYINNIKPLFVKNSDAVETAVGEGDIPIIGATGVLFGLEGGLDCLVLASFFAFLFIVFAKDKEIPFIPSLSLAIFVNYNYPFHLISILI